MYYYDCFVSYVTILSFKYGFILLINFINNYEIYQKFLNRKNEYYYLYFTCVFV